MKKIIIFISVVFLLSGLSLGAGYAADCKVKWNGTYNVEANCTWPGNYKVYGDINVGTRTVTIPTGRVMGIDLNNQKITFTTGKILMSGTAKIDNSVSTRYKIQVPYTRGTGVFNVTNCPSGFNVLNRINNNTPTGYQGSTVRNVNQNGNLNCGP